MGTVPVALGLAGSPVQWAAVGLLAVLIFAPSLFPPLARLLGRLVRGEMFRRLGVPPPRPKPRPAPREEPEVVPPRRSQPTMRASDPTPLGPTVRREGAGRTSWWVPAVVCAAIGVILWYLLHGR